MLLAEQPAESEITCPEQPHHATICVHFVISGDLLKRYRQLKVENEQLQGERNVLREQKNGLQDQCHQLHVKIGN